VAFKYTDLMSAVLPEARPRAGWPDQAERWLADGECHEGTCKEKTDQCAPTCPAASGIPCNPSNRQYRETSQRQAADFGLLQEQLRQTLALGL
jgi:hypothetical protein